MWRRLSLIYGADYHADVNSYFLPASSLLLFQAEVIVLCPENHQKSSWECPDFGRTCFHYEESVWVTWGRVGRLKDTGVAYGAASCTQTQKGGSKAHAGEPVGRHNRSNSHMNREAKKSPDFRNILHILQNKNLLPLPGQKETHLKFACLMMVSWGFDSEIFSSKIGHTPVIQGWGSKVLWNGLELVKTRDKLEKEAKKTCFCSALCSCWRLTVVTLKRRNYEDEDLQVFIPEHYRHSW